MRGFSPRRRARFALRARPAGVDDAGTGGGAAPASFAASIHPRALPRETACTPRGLDASGPNQREGPD